jgi:hypothetical protein
MWGTIRNSAVHFETKHEAYGEECEVGWRSVKGLHCYEWRFCGGNWAIGDERDA